MIQWASKHPKILLALLIVLAFFTADGIHVINYPPTSIHQWRQSDCFAYARNYFTKNSGLLSPSFYNLVVTDGRSISELPILYYLSAKLFHIFGVHYWVLRGLTFLVFIVGLFYLYNCIRFWIKDPLAAIFPVILLATTPYYYYYGLNFLPNVPAISLSFAGLYYMLLYEQLGTKKYLIASTIFFIFSTLFKPTDGGIIWVAYLCVVGKDVVFNRLRDKKIIPLIVSAVIIGASIFGWYKYANWYNTVNKNTLNLLGFYPIWDMSKNDIIYTIRWRMGEYWVNSYQHRIVLYFLGILLILFVVKWRSLQKFLKFFTLFLFLGSLVYSILWFKAFDIHDYYQLINVIAPVFLIITILEYYYQKIIVNSNTAMRYAVVFLMAGLVTISIYHNHREQQKRYDIASPETYKKRYFYGIEPYLRTLGISPNDTVISIPDITPNITLVGIGNSGYTSMYSDNDFTLSHFKNQGAKYLIISDTSYLHNPLFTPYMSKLMGKYYDICIFDLR